MRVHIKPTLGRAKLKTLNPAQVRALYRERLEGGSSPRTVQYVHVTLHKALEQAQGDGLVARNAAKGIKAPRPKKKEIAPLTGFRDVDTAKLLDDVTTFNFHPHLPHYELTAPESDET